MTHNAVVLHASFTYDFVVPDPGTYFLLSHVGLQLDRGLYAPLIIDDPDEPGDYDAEWIVTLDDWLDGTGQTPDEVLARRDRKSTRLNSSHVAISYAVFCLKKKRSHRRPRNT